MPKWEHQIRRMFSNEAKQTRTARSSVRKSGVRPGEVVLSRPRTVIDAYMSPFEQPLARQYLIDFTNVTQVRISSQSNVNIYVLYSVSVDSQEFDPGDYAPLFDTTPQAIFSSRTFSDSGDDLRWFTLAPQLRIPLRLTLSTNISEPNMNPNTLDNSFSAALQVF